MRESLSSICGLVLLLSITHVLANHDGDQGFEPFGTTPLPPDQIDPWSGNGPNFQNLRMGVGRQFLSIGSGKCAYVLTRYNCQDGECLVSLRPFGSQCGAHKDISSVLRVISVPALQKIIRQAEPGQSIIGTSLTYGGGVVWPENGVGDFQNN